MLLLEVWKKNYETSACANLVEIDAAVLENDFVNVFSLCRHYLTLEKGGALHLKKIESLHQMMPCAKLVEIGKVVLETKMKM